jgi:hypothetical protein
MSIIEEIDERAQELRDTGAIVSLIDWDNATQESLERELEGFNLEYNVIPFLLRKFQYNKGDGLVMVGINWGELEGIEPIVHEFMQICNEIGKVKGPWGPLMYCMEDPNQPGAKLEIVQSGTQDFVFVEPRVTMERIMTFESISKQNNIYVMRIKKFDEKFTNFTNGDYLPQEMAFADLMSDAEIEDRFDVTRDYRPTIYKKSVIYNFTIKTGEWVNDGMRSVTYTKPENLYEDFKKRTDFVEEIYIACQRTQDEYPEVKLEMTESCTISSVLGNKLTIKVIMSINEKN